ncbi:MAG: CDP-diacylglycerol--glycerol-3-phosphate 3-phosphatidyltransferase [Candidatus Caccovivens sp.]
MNLPNKITISRIFLIPLFVFFYLVDFIPYGKLIATIIFIVACWTDALDGHIARKNNLVTNLGKFLDPIADKVLAMSGILLLIATPITPNVGTEIVPIIYPTYIGIIAGIIILARELIISAFRQIAATKNVVLAADIYGKIKAVFQDITLAFYFIYAFVIEEFYNASIQAWKTTNAVLSIVGYVLLAITVIMTIVSGVKYITNNKQVLKD